MISNHNKLKMTALCVLNKRIWIRNWPPWSHGNTILPPGLLNAKQMFLIQNKCCTHGLRHIKWPPNHYYGLGNIHCSYTTGDSNKPLWNLILTIYIDVSQIRWITSKNFWIKSQLQIIIIKTLNLIETNSSMLGMKFYSALLVHMFYRLVDVLLE